MGLWNQASEVSRVALPLRASLSPARETGVRQQRSGFAGETDCRTSQGFWVCSQSSGSSYARIRPWSGSRSSAGQALVPTMGSEVISAGVVLNVRLAKATPVPDWMPKIDVESAPRPWRCGC